MSKNYVLRFTMPGLTLILLFFNYFVHAANKTSMSFKITGVLEAKTCSFEGTSLSFELPEVNTRSLNNSNSIQKTTFIPLLIDCSSGVTSVIIRPYGTAVSNGDKTLFLNTHSAKNVGLRLLDKYGNILTPDGQTKVEFNYRESGGRYTFMAGYAATGGGRVSGGSFQSLVTFSLTYS